METADQLPDPDKAELVARTRDFMNDIAASALLEGIPGIGLAADIAGTPIQVFAGVTHAIERHPLTAHSRFRLACVNHGLLAVALHAIRLPRRLSVDETLNSHLPEFAAVDPHGTIRLRHLLSHSTGYDYQSPATVPSGPTFSCLVAAPKIVFPAGEHLYYSADNTLLLEQVLTHHTGLSPSALIARHVLEPPRISRSASGAAEQAAHDVRGHVRDPDLLSFHPAPEQGGPDDLRIALPAVVDACRTFLCNSEGELRRLFLTPASHVPPAIGGTGFRRFPSAYSMGWGIFESGLFGVNGTGRGQCCAIRFDPDKRICFAAGLTIADAELREQITELMEHALGLDTGRARTAQMELTEETVLTLAGEYAQMVSGSRVTAQITQAGESITIRVTEGQRVLPALTILRRDTSGRWNPAEGAKVLPIRFLLAKPARAVGVMIGAAGLWRQ